MNDLTIGVLVGMGIYATIHFFQQYAEVFPAEREWERPRIVIDNRCTMHSHVCALFPKEVIMVFIESVKQNRHTDVVEENFLRLLEGQDNCILGCTELPIMHEKYSEKISSKNIYDSLLLGLNKIRSGYADE